MTRSILVYYPDPAEARAYADLIRLPSRAFRVHVASTPDEAAGPGAGAEIFYCWGPPRPLLAGAKGLRWIQCMGAGVERLLVPELPADVRVTRAAGIFGPWMAEYTLGWCLWVTQRMDGFRASQRQRRWAPVDPAPLRGQTLCVVGLGDIGRTIAKTARALGMQVIGVTRSGRATRDARRVYRTKALRAALARADFVVLTLPLSEETRGLLGRAELAAMKPTAWLLNLARGPIVDEAALLDALRGRRHRRRGARRLQHRAPARRTSALGLRQRGDHAAHLGPQHPARDRAHLQRQPPPLRRQPPAPPHRRPHPRLLRAVPPHIPLPSGERAG